MTTAREKMNLKVIITHLITMQIHDEYTINHIHKTSTKWVMHSKCMSGWLAFLQQKKKNVKKSLPLELGRISTVSTHWHTRFSIFHPLFLQSSHNGNHHQSYILVFCKIGPGERDRKAWSNRQWWESEAIVCKIDSQESSNPRIKLQLNSLKNYTILAPSV